MNNLDSLIAMHRACDPASAEAASLLTQLHDYPTADESEDERLTLYIGEVRLSELRNRPLATLIAAIRPLSMI